MNKNYLARVPENYEFILINGTKLASLLDLEKELKIIDESIYSYHVNETKNDFHNWIRDVIKDNKLAEDIKGDISKSVMHKKIKERIEEIKKHLNEAYKKEMEKKKESEKKHNKKDEEKINELLKKLEETKKKDNIKIEREKQKIKREKEEVDYYKSLIIKEFFYGFVSGVLLTLIILRIAAIL